MGTQLHRVPPSSSSLLDSVVGLEGVRRHMGGIERLPTAGGEGGEERKIDHTNEYHTVKYTS